ncbi:MAG TPA: Hpt domain-containing protein [Noviherbaspirillum sp.]|uniref:Hpt domain-containing protein n=1 Tax=Noviherbaspirillum sp. TaxID=1926288 RepID=UPI002B4AAA82|nr:Hpt domain-containing protein [Noviherbaspirillum sp.]HJV84132.1 Hpt domain-containing protein [Noviherbaspirillum sp.]
MNHSFRLIDPQLLMKATGNDEAAFVHLLGVFLRIAPESLAALESAFRQGDQRAIEKEAHSLKSSLALVGATAASDLLGSLEKNARRNQANSDWGSFDSVRFEIQRVIDEVSDFLAAH